MEIKIQKTDLVDCLSLVIGAVNSRGSLPILSNVLLETVG